ncbi:MAG: hypothetical protein U0271_11160 [Polyangiaceae bacterium]
MSDPQRSSSEELAFQPVFAHAAPAVASAQLTWLVSGMSPYPTPAAARAALPVARAERAIVETEQWLERIVFEEWRSREPLTWFALAGSALADEALYCGWLAGDRLLQVAADRAAVHLRTPLGRLEATDPGSVLSKVVALGSTLLQHSLRLDEYEMLNVGDFLVGSPLLGADAGLTAPRFATDGVGVRFLVPKATDTRAHKAPAPFAPPAGPWFAPAAPARADK